MSHSIIVPPKQHPFPAIQGTTTSSSRDDANRPSSTSDRSPARTHHHRPLFRNFGPDFVRDADASSIAPAPSIASSPRQAQQEGEAGAASESVTIAFGSPWNSHQAEQVSLNEPHPSPSPAPFPVGARYDVDQSRARGALPSFLPSPPDDMTDAYVVPPSWGSHRCSYRGWPVTSPGRALRRPR